ncbi:LamG-like jellyroll fold domain-containing protein, partial [Aquiflexum gelatinilyticum]
NQNYPTNGTWMHVAVTFDGTKTTMYINGVEDNSATYAPVTIRPNTTNLQIGAWDGINRWTGDLDEVRLYGRALSSAEILNLANSGGAFRTNDNPVIKGGSENSQENNSALEKNTQEIDRPGVTRMFPNPVFDLINLKLSNFQEDRVQVSIFDMKGILLLDQEFENENGTLVLDISKLSLKPGTHVLLVNTNGNQQVFKFLKK